MFWHYPPSCLAPEKHFYSPLLFSSCVHVCVYVNTDACVHMCMWNIWIQISLTNKPWVAECRGASGNMANWKQWLDKIDSQSCLLSQKWSLEQSGITFLTGTSAYSKVTFFKKKDSIFHKNNVSVLPQNIHLNKNRVCINSTHKILLLMAEEYFLKAKYMLLSRKC